MIKHKLKKHTELLYSKKFLFAFTIVFCLISIWEFTYFSYTKSAHEHILNLNDSSKIISIHIPKNLNFAGEKVPVTDFATRKSIEKEFLAIGLWKAQSTLLYKRATRWFPIIEPILKQNDIPDDFKYIALVESQLTNAISPRGATGFWQFVPSAAKSFNLEINEDVDERLHVIKSTQAACKYFKQAYKIFKNWTLVAASYNRGIEGVQNQLNKQNKEEYYTLDLTNETSRYIFKLLAMKEIISRPNVYGYDISKKNNIPFSSTKKITIDTTINNLSDFASQNKTNLEFLKAVNPWLISNKLTNPENKKYIIEIPINKDFVYTVNGDLIEINHVKDTILIDSLIADSVKGNSTLIKNN